MTVPLSAVRAGPVPGTTRRIAGSPTASGSICATWKPLTVWVDDLRERDDCVDLLAVGVPIVAHNGAKPWAGPRKAAQQGRALQGTRSEQGSASDQIQDWRTNAVSDWYHQVMAMTLRLTDEDTEALRAKAAEEGRSMQEVALTAVREYTSDRPARVRRIIRDIITEDSALLERLRTV